MFPALPALGLAAVFALMLAACRPPDPAPTEPLRIGMDKWAGYFPLVLADERGYLREENRDAFAADGGLPRACAEYADFFLSRGMPGRRPAPGDLLHAGFVE
jgi:hypothetical protein